MLPHLSKCHLGIDYVGWVEKKSCWWKTQNTQLPTQIPEPQWDVSCPSLASQVVGKMPKCGTFSVESTKKKEVSFEQWAFEVKNVMKSHTVATLREGLVWSLYGVAADLVSYLGSQAPVSEIIDKLELVCSTMASFDILMQNVYKLLQGKTKKWQYIYIPIVGGTECGLAGIPYDVQH